MARITEMACAVLEDEGLGGGTPLIEFVEMELSNFEFLASEKLISQKFTKKLLQLSM